MAKTLKDIAHKLPRIANEAVGEWLLDKYHRITEDLRSRARLETYGGKFSKSIQFKHQPTEQGAEGEIFSTHPRAKEIIKSFEEGRPGYSTQKAFFIEKKGSHPGERTPEGHLIVQNKEGVSGIWVRKSGPILAEHLWSDIARTPPSLEFIYQEKWKKVQGGA